MISKKVKAKRAKAQACARGGRTSASHLTAEQRIERAKAAAAARYAQGDLAGLRAGWKSRVVELLSLEPKASVREIAATLRNEARFYLTDRTAFAFVESTIELLALEKLAAEPRPKCPTCRSVKSVQVNYYGPLHLRERDVPAGVRSAGDVVTGELFAWHCEQCGDFNAPQPKGARP